MEKLLTLCRISEKVKKIGVHQQEYGSFLKMDFPQFQ